MVNKLKQWYSNEYQQTAYEISVARVEYDKIGSFTTPTLLVISALKLFIPKIPLWSIPVLLVSVTVSAKWIGKFLIKLGVPKKNAELSNAQNPQMVDIIERLERIERK